MTGSSQNDPRNAPPVAGPGVGSSAGSGRVVAELGRPETPQEAAERKAAASRTYREAKTVRNLIVALVASLALVLAIVMVVVRPDAPPREPVDYASIAASVQGDHEATIASPVLADDWASNSARVERGSDGVASWYIGFVTPTEEFAAITQGIDANPTWVAATLRGAFATGTAEIAGATWDVYDRRGVDGAGNYEYALVTVVGSSTLVVHGTAPDAEINTLATAVIDSVTDDPARDAPPSGENE